MNQEMFQKLIKEIIDNAKNNEGVILIEDLKKELPEKFASEEKLESICKYLKSVGVCVIGSYKVEEEELPQEEKELYEQYLEACPIKASQEEIKSDILSFSSGNMEAKDKIILELLPYIANEAREAWEEEFPIMDLIEEGNLALIDYLNCVEKTDFETIITKIRKGLYSYIKSQKEEFSKDEELVNKVKRLEEYAKEVGEDGKKLSINELAILLDMDIEEIEDILRLTGEE